MDEAGIRQAEERIWASIRDAAPGCDSVEVCDPWRKGPPVPFQVPVGHTGQGLLSWLPVQRRRALRSVASGPVQGDRVQLILIQTATNSVPLNARLMARSDWSRRGIPLTEALAFPEGVVLSRNEADAALAAETDYRCLWFAAEGQPSSLCAFSAEEYDEQTVLSLAKSLRDPEFRERYATLGSLRGPYPRYTRKYPISTAPESRFLIVKRERDPLLAMTRQYTRLFQGHRVLEVLNLYSPVPEVDKEAE